MAALFVSGLLSGRTRDQAAGEADADPTPTPGSAESASGSELPTRAINRSVACAVTYEQDRG